MFVNIYILVHLFDVEVGVLDPASRLVLHVLTSVESKTNYPNHTYRSGQRSDSTFHHLYVTVPRNAVVMDWIPTP